MHIYTHTHTHIQVLGQSLDAGDFSYPAEEEIPAPANSTNSSGTKKSSTIKFSAAIDDVSFDIATTDTNTLIAGVVYVYVCIYIYTPIYTWTQKVIYN